MSEQNKKVKFVFYCLEKHSAELKIRLLYDGLTQSAFFGALLQKYINNDEAMIELVAQIKQDSKTMGKAKIKNAKQDLQKGKEIMKELGITKSDKEKIFDIIEMDLDEYEW
tara:strand:- start:471 stop:803 length:333 start_codon:yes stop_codon:yes gene_type:complete